MKILLVNDYGITLGGAEEYFFTLARELAARGHHVTTISSDHQRGGRLPGTDLQLTSCGNWKNLDALFNPRAFLQMKRAIAAHSPDCIHFHNVFYSLSPSVLYAAAQVRSVLTLHDYFAICLGDKTLDPGVACREPLASCAGCRCRSARPRMEILRRRAARAGLARVTRLVAPSEYVAKEYRRNGVDDITVLPHPVVAPRLALVEAVEDRQAGPFRLLFLGRLAPQKGAEVAIRALSLARAHHDSITLDIAGDGPLRPSLEALCNELDVSGQVVFHGWCDASAREALYRRASVVLQPAIWPEVAGLTALEAAARGIPVIAADIGALPETVKDHITGCLYTPPDSPPALAEKILALCTDSKLLLSLSKGARKLCTRRTLAAHLDALEALYQG